jgi:hypothetical protein
MSEQPVAASAVNAMRVTIVDGDRPTANAIGRVLTSAGAVVDIVAPSATSDLGEPRELVVVNYEGLDAATRSATVRALKAAHRRVLVYSGNCIKSDLAELFGTTVLTNLLAKNPDVDAAELLVTIQKILQNDLFGLEKYFPWGAPRASYKIASSAERPRFLEDVRAFADSMKLHERMLMHLVTVADELVTNGLYDAPVDDSGASRFAHLSRREEVVLGPGEELDVTLCRDGRRVGIAVSDRFGSLSPTRVTDYLGKCYRKGGDQVDAKEGGAGLGFYYAFEALSHLIINIAPGKRTEVIGLLEVPNRYKDFAARAKSFNIFVEQ